MALLESAAIMEIGSVGWFAEKLLPGRFSAGLFGGIIGLLVAGVWVILATGLTKVSFSVIA